MINFEFDLPTKIMFGKDSQLKVADLIETYGKKVLIHYGSDRIKKNGLFSQVTGLLKEKGIAYVELGGAKSNPSLKIAEEGSALCKKEKIDMVLAIGGGSVIDSAKAIAIGACMEADIWSVYLGETKVKKALPIGAIVTISASASEANSMSVISNYETHDKRALFCPASIPKFAILNPEYTLTLSSYNTAISAVDIFAHAFERYFDLRRNSLIWDYMCEAVMRTVLEVAPKLLESPENYDLRSELMWAATVAHSNMVGTGGDFTSHELSHILTAQYGISHGEALAIIMPAWCKYMLDKYPIKFSIFGNTLWATDNGKVAIEKLVSFIKSLGLPADLKTAGITDLDPESFARLAFTNGIESLGGGLGEVKLQDAEKIFALARG